MSATTQTMTAAFDKMIEEQRTRINAEVKAQTQKVSAIHPGLFAKGMLGLAQESAATTPEVSHEDFGKAMNAMRLHYSTAKPNGPVVAFHLPEMLAKPVVMTAAAHPVAGAHPLITLTKEGNEATGHLMAQAHAEVLAALQAHASACFEGLKSFTQAQDLAAFKKKMDATAAALKAQVNSTIDKLINQALQIGAKHADQHSALASLINGAGALIGGVAHGLSGAVNDAVHGIATAAKDIGGAVSKAAQGIGHAVSSAVSSIGHFFGL